MLIIALGRIQKLLLAICHISTVTQAEAKKLVKDALRAASKAKEVAESRAAAISRDSFTASALSFANFTPLNSFDRKVGADPVNSLTKQPTHTVPSVDVPSQAS